MLRAAARWLTCSLILAASACCSIANAESGDPKAEAIPFDALVARIRKAEESQDWRKAGWNDETIEASLHKLVASLKLATGKEFLKLPVEFKDVSADRDERFAAFEGGLLRVFKGSASVSHARKSIFLVDGSIQISHASDSIVIARGAVDIGHGNRNLIIAGNHAEIAHDGNDAFRDGLRPDAVGVVAKHGSIIVCGGSVEISHAQGTVCDAPSHLRISHATQVSFLNSPNRAISHEHESTHCKATSLPIVIPAPRALPAEIFKITQIVAADDRAKRLVTIERNGIEYVLRPGAKLVDETGKPVPKWEDWSVGFITRHAVLFTDGKRDVSVFVL